MMGIQHDDVPFTNMRGNCESILKLTNKYPFTADNIHLVYSLLYTQVEFHMEKSFLKFP